MGVRGGGGGKIWLPGTTLFELSGIKEFRFSLWPSKTWKTKENGGNVNASFLFFALFFALFCFHSFGLVSVHPVRLALALRPLIHLSLLLPTPYPFRISSLCWRFCLAHTNDDADDAAVFFVFVFIICFALRSVSFLIRRNFIFEVLHIDQELTRKPKYFSTWYTKTTVISPFLFSTFLHFLVFFFLLFLQNYNFSIIAPILLRKNTWQKRMLWKLEHQLKSVEYAKELRRDSVVPFYVFCQILVMP